MPVMNTSPLAVIPNDIRAGREQLKDFRAENGSSQGQNLALTGLFVPEYGLGWLTCSGLDWLICSLTGLFVRQRTWPDALAGPVGAMPVMNTLPLSCCPANMAHI